MIKSERINKNSEISLLKNNINSNKNNNKLWIYIIMLSSSKYIIWKAGNLMRNFQQEPMKQHVQHAVVDITFTATSFSLDSYH